MEILFVIIALFLVLGVYLLLSVNKQKHEKAKQIRKELGILFLLFSLLNSLLYYFLTQGWTSAVLVLMGLMTITAGFFLFRIVRL